MKDEPQKPVRAVSLFSGGLDSMLAARLAQLQDVEVLAVFFRSVFFDSYGAERAASSLGMPIVVEDFTAAILAVLGNPKHGFGAGMNPCVDCHIEMLRRAGRIMEREGFDFIITGEVLGQRPMSQNRRALELVASESGYGELVVRPLSAKLLAPTLPETRGWLNRERLPGLRGRGRKPQMKLAAEMGLPAYPQPAGGCLLTDPGYSAKLRDLQAHEGLKEIRRIELLRVGRHFRIGKVKLIVGRDKRENELLEQAASPEEILLKCERFPGPAALLGAGSAEADVLKAGAICARYGDCPNNVRAGITVSRRSGTREIRVMPADTETLDPLRV